MKKQQLDHVLRAAGRITGEKQFVIIGSQSLHNRELARRKLVTQERLLTLLSQTLVSDDIRERICRDIASDFSG